MAGAAGTAGAQQEVPPQEIGGVPELAGVERLGSLRRWAARVLAVLVLVLAVSGAYLWFRYTPTSASSWPGLADGASPRWRLQDVVRTVHRWTSYGAVALSVVVGGLALGEAIERRGHRLRWAATPVAAAVVVVATLAASFTGFLLPWDQLALKAVTVGTDVSGLTPLFGDQIRFVLIGGAEVSVGAVRTVAIVHLALGALLIALVATLALARTRTRPRPHEPPEPPPEQPPEQPPELRR